MWMGQARDDRSRWCGATVPLQLVALVGQHRRDLQDDACGSQQSGTSFVDALLVDTVALVATEYNNAAPVSRVGWAHPQT